MIKIKRISNEEEIHLYVLENSVDMHNELIGFLHSLNFEKKEIMKIDTPFSELEEEYIFTKNKDMKIHFFIGKNKTQMVIDSQKSQRKLVVQMKEYFLFPNK